MDNLKQTNKWVIWKTKDKWSTSLYRQWVSTFECWVRNRAEVPVDTQASITRTLLPSNRNFGKDEYVVDLAGHEARYWQGTKSGLIGSFEFKGACQQEMSRVTSARGP